jgi:hypothetical protein
LTHKWNYKIRPVQNRFLPKNTSYNGRDSHKAGDKKSNFGLYLHKYESKLTTDRFIGYCCFVLIVDVLVLDIDIAGFVLNCQARLVFDHRFFVD